MIDVALHAEQIAIALLGSPNEKLSSDKELRFGRKGSLCIDLSKGTFYDHENEEGGGMLSLIQRERGESSAVEGGARAEEEGSYEGGGEVRREGAYQGQKASFWQEEYEGVI